MKRFLLLILALSMTAFCVSAQADPEEWPVYEGDGYTIRCPEDMDLYGVPEEETGWNMEVFEDPAGRDENGKPQIYLTVIRADVHDWMQWEETGFPTVWGDIETMQRMEVDEPTVDLVTDMNMSYRLYRTGDSRWLKKVIILEAPEFDDPDYVIISRFPAYDDMHYEDIQDWMIESMTFPWYRDPEEGPTNGVTGGGNEDPDGDNGFSFFLDTDFFSEVAYQTYPVTVDKDAPSFYLYTDTEVMDLVVERLEWDDSTFTVTSVTPVYETDMMVPEDALCIQAWIPEMLPDLRIRATGYGGDEGCWYITESGEDGSLILVPEEELLP